MKKMINRIVVIIVSFALVVTSVGFIPGSYAAEDTEGPQLDMASMEINKQIITDPYEAPTVKVKVTDQSEIESVNFFYSLGEDYGSVATAMLEYNASTGYYEGSVGYDGRDYDIGEYAVMAFYGDYKLKYIQAMDVYGNITSMDNLHLPNMNFSVVGGVSGDASAPVIDFDHITVEAPKGNETKAFVTVPVTDESKIIHGTLSYFNKNGDGVASFLSKKSDGIYQFELNLSSKGQYQFERMEIIDANFNRIAILNCDSIFYSEGAYSGIAKSLGHLDFQYGESSSEELEVSIKSMELSNAIIEREAENETLKVTFDSSIPLDVAYASCRSKSVVSGPVGTKIDDYTFEFQLPAYYYGQWLFEHLSVMDIYGNCIMFYDLDVEPWTDGVLADLSDGDYYVGIIDPETGLGVSDSEFDHTTKLDVDEEAIDGNLGQDMVSEDAIGIGMYEVDVTGKRDDKTAVSFVAPEGCIDGDIVEIVHKRHDGTNEIFAAEVKHGRITIETDEFSPFVIQVDKDHQHRYTRKTIVKKATLTKSGSYKEKCYACDATGKTKKLKPAQAALSKSSFAYTGKNISGKKLPKVIVKDASGKLISPDNYTVKKPSNVKKMKNIGRYPYKIDFKKSCAEYSGSKTIYLEITPNKTTVSSLKPEKKVISVKWKKGKKDQVTGYEILVATDSNFKKNKKSVIVKGYSKESKKITKLKSKTKYYVKVRAYKTIKGVRIYSDWSKVKTIKTK